MSHIIKTERPDIVAFTSLFSYYIKVRDGFVCGLCGSKARLNNSHLISAQLTIIRWDEKNCHCQCSGCNKRHEFYPHIYTNWFIKKYGFEEYERLCKLANLKQPLPDEVGIKHMTSDITIKLGKLLENTNGRHYQMR
jgi:hypothetical protein